MPYYVRISYTDMRTYVCFMNTLQVKKLKSCAIYAFLIVRETCKTLSTKS